MILWASFSLALNFRTLVGVIFLAYIIFSMLGLSQIESGCKVPRLTEEKAEPLVEGGARSMLASVWRPSAFLLLNLLFKKLFIFICSLFMPLSSSLASLVSYLVIWFLEGFLMLFETSCYQIVNLNHRRRKSYFSSDEVFLGQKMILEETAPYSTPLYRFSMTNCLYHSFHRSNRCIWRTPFYSTTTISSSLAYQAPKMNQA